MMGGLCVFLILIPAQARRHWKCLSVLVLGGGVLLAVFSGFAPNRIQAPFGILRNSVEGTMPLLWSRPEIWAATGRMIQDHFWAGTGIGTFFLYYQGYRGADFGSSGLMAHNEPLQFWAEMGVFAPFLFYGFIVAGFVRTWRALKKPEAGDPLRVAILAPFCGLGAMVVHAHITFHFHVPVLLVFAGFPLAVWFYATGKALAQPYKALSSLKSGVMAALPLMAFTGIFAAFLGSALLIRQAEQAVLAGDMKTFSKSVNGAAKLSHNFNPGAFVLAASVPLGILGAGQKDEALFGLLERAERLNPRLAAIPYHQAALAELSGQDEEAETLFQKALALDPMYLAARQKLAALYRSKGQVEKAADILKDGLKWPYKQQNALAYYQDAAKALLEAGDMDSHELAMEGMARHVYALKNANATGFVIGRDDLITSTLKHN